MSLKKVLEKDFKNFDKIILKRFKSSKLIFVGFSLNFFINYFLVSNFPKVKIFIYLLPYSYVSFIVGLLLISYYSLRIKFKKKINTVFSIVISIFLVIIGIVFMSIFLIDPKFFN